MGLDFSVDQPVMFAHQMPKALLFAGYGADHRDAQPCGEGPKIDLNSFSFGFVEQIDADQNPAGNFHRLQNKIEIPFQAGGITHHHNRVGFSEADEVAGDLLLGRVGHQRVGPGNVHHHIGMAACGAETLCAGNRFSRPVSGMLVQPGQAVKDGAFPHVGISRESHDPVLRRLPSDFQAGIHRPDAR